MAAGCTTATKPNAAYTGVYPKAFNELSIKNPLLAQELGKLPEIQDGISETDATALARICVYCLRKAGYQAYAITVYHGNTPRPNHVSCAFTDKNGKAYILDNTLTAYSRGPGLYERTAYLNI